MGNGASYNAYKKRKQRLTEAYSQSPYSQLQSEVRQVGRETQRAVKQTGDILKRQNAPIGARLEATRELQTNYAQNIGAAYERVSQQDQQRKQGLILELEEVNARMAEAKEAEDKAALNTAIQVVSTGVGAAVGFVGTGFNPAGALAGAQYGAAAGQAISGGYNIAKGDATAQDWSNLGQGIISGVSLGAEQATLKSIKAENTESMAEMTRIWNDDTIPDAQKQWMFQQIELGLSQGMTMNEITSAWSGIKWNTDGSQNSGVKYDYINNGKGLANEQSDLIRQF